MKKLATLLLIAVATISVTSAQTKPPANITGINDTRYPGRDTVTSLVSASASLSKTTAISGAKDLVGFQVDVTKISGAVKGWIEHMVSIDTGAQYTSISSVALKDTAIKSYYFNYNYNPAYYHKIKVTDTGVQSSSYTIWKITRD